MCDISFVIPVYNKARYLPHVLEALTLQSLSMSYEYIIIDDGSTDHSWSLIQSFAARVAGVVALRQANRGPSAAVNQGLSLARGEFIKFVDGDDVLLPHATSALWKAARTNGCDVVYGLRSHHYALETPLFLPRHPPSSARFHRLFHPLQAVLRGKHSGMSSFAGTTGLVKTNLLHRIGGSDERVFIQDFSMALRCALYGSIGRLDQEVALLAPRTIAYDHLSDNRAQEAHDALLALLFCIEEHQEDMKGHERDISRRIAKILWNLHRHLHGWRSIGSGQMFGYLLSKGRCPSMDTLRRKMMASVRSLQHQYPPIRTTLRFEREWSR